MNLRHINAIIIFLILLIAFPLRGVSQKYAIHAYSQDGFPDIGAVSTIFQDSRGIMWFGGSRGVAFYDGRTFHRFSTANGLKDNFTYTIKESNDGKIWIATYHGINIYDPTIDSLTYFPTVPGPAIRDLEFTDDFVLIATSGSAYSIPLNGSMGSLGHYDILQDLSYSNEPLLAPVNDLHFDKATGNLWISSAKVGLLKVNLTQYEKLWEMKDKTLQKEYQTIGHNQFHAKYPDLIDRSSILSNMELKLSLFTVSDIEERRKIIEANTKIYNINGSGKEWIVTNTSFDPSGNVYVHARDKVFRIVDDELVVQGGFNKLAGNLDRFGINSKGQFMLSGEKGAFVVTSTDTMRLNSETGLSNDPVSYLFCDHQQILWGATESGSLFKIVDKTFKIYDAETDELLKDTKSAIKLSDGSILIGGKSGISLFKDGKVIPFFFQPPEGESFIGFAFDKNGDLIVSTTTCIYLIKGRHVTLLASDLDIVHNEVKYALDGNNRLWIVMGMKVFTWDTVKLKPEKNLEKHIYLCTYIYRGLDGDMFFGTWRGLYRLRGDQLWLYTFGHTLLHDLNDPDSDPEEIDNRENSKIVDDVVTCGGVGLDNAYWFGTFGGGLLRLKNDSMTSYCLDEMVASRHINQSHVDEDGNIYFLGDEGISKVTKDGIIPIDTDTDINANFFDMEIDGRGRKLLATSEGLIISTPTQQVIIDKSYGLENDDILTIISIDADRYLLLQKHGFTTVDIGKLTANDHHPRPLTINSFRANGETIRTDRATRLQSHQRDIVFKFSLNDFIDESKNRYSWKLEGLDDSFSELSPIQEASYQRLPAGSYRFNIKAMNSKGKVILNNSPISFEVQAYFYETTLFHILLVLSGAFIVYLFIRIRIRNVQKRNHLLESTVSHRTKDLEEALHNIKTLKGLIPICANCKKIRDDGGVWQQVEEYIADHSEANFSHGICPDCIKVLYPEIYDTMKKDKGKE